MLKFFSALVFNLVIATAAISQPDTTLYVRNPQGNGIITIRHDAFMYVKGNMKLVETKGLVAKTPNFSFFLMMNENGAFYLTGNLDIKSDTTILQTRVRGNFIFQGDKVQQEVTGLHTNFCNLNIENLKSVTFSTDSILLQGHCMLTKGNMLLSQSILNPNIDSTFSDPMINESSSSKVVGQVYSRVAGIDNSYLKPTTGYLGTGLTFALASGQQFRRFCQATPLPEGVNLLPVTEGATKKDFELVTKDPAILPISEALFFTSDTSKLSTINELGLFASIDPEGHGNAFRQLSSDAPTWVNDSIVLSNVVETTNALSNTYRIVAANKQCNNVDGSVYFSTLKNDIYVCSGDTKTFSLSNGCNKDSYYTITWELDGTSTKADVLIKRFSVSNDSVVVVGVAVIDPRGCKFSKSFNVHVIASAQPSILFSPGFNAENTACQGVNYTVKSSFARELKTGESISFHWVLGDETNFGNADSIQYKFARGVDKQKFSLITLLSNGTDYQCKDTAIRTVDAMEQPTIMVDYNKCEGQPAELNASWSAFNVGARFINRMDWSVNGATDGVDLTNVQTEHALFDGILDQPIYNVNIRAVSNQACAIDTSFAIEVSSIPSLSIKGNGVIQLGDSAVYEPIVDNLDGKEFIWNCDGKSISSIIYWYKANEVKEDTVSLTVRTDQGCERLENKTVTVIPKLNVDFIENGTCQGEKYTFAAISNIDDIRNAAHGKLVTVSYLWTMNGQSLSSDSLVEKEMNDTGDKTIKLTVTVNVDNVIFSKSITKTIAVNPVPSATISLADICDRDSEGKPNAVLATAILSNGNYGSITSSSWSFGDGAVEDYPGWKQPQPHLYNQVKNYTVALTLTDNKGCGYTATKVVTVRESPSITLKPDYHTCGDSFEIPLEAPSATGAWTFIWSNGSASMNPLVHSGGQYSVTVSANGCVTKASTNVTLNSVANIDFGIPQPAVGCDSVNLNIGTSWKTISWSDGNSLPSRTIKNSGSYTVNATDQNGCSASNTVDVTINPSPKGNPKEFLNTCSDKQVTLTSSLNNSGYTYQWFLDKKLLGTEPYINTGVAGNYSVKIIDGNGCSATEEFDLTVNPLPTFDFGSTVTACDATTLTAPIDGDAYSWSTGNTSKSIDVDTSGNYSLMITRNGCSFQDNVDVVVNKTPLLTVDPFVEVCEGLDARVAIETDALQVLWNNGVTEKEFFTKFPGKYEVIASNGNGCYSRGSVTVAVNPAPALSLKDKYVICGSEFKLSAGGSAAGYLWTGPNGFSSSSKEVTVEKEGQYTVTATSSKGCTTIASTNLVVIDQSLTANFLAAGNLKKGESLQLLNFSYPKPYNLKWSLSNGYVTEEEDPVVVFYLAGEYTVNLKVWNDGCLDSLQKKIVVDDVVFQNPNAENGSEGDSLLSVREFNVYPNPASDRLNVEVRLSEPADIMLMVSDITGRVILAETVNKSEVAMKVVNMKPFSKGSYIISFSAGKLFKSKKIVKE